LITFDGEAEVNKAVNTIFMLSLSNTCMQISAASADPQ
jgi:hypothetical protein